MTTTEFYLRGFRVHYGEHTGVWWVESIRGSLNGLQFRTREQAVAWIMANSR